MKFRFLVAVALLFFCKVFAQDAPLPLMTVVHEFVHEEPVTDVSVTPDGKHALTLTAKALHVWSLIDGTLDRTIAIQDCRALRCIEMSADGLFVAVSEPQTIVLIDSTKWQEKRRISLGDLSYHKDLAFSPDGSFLLIGGLAGFAYRSPLLWNLTNDKIQIAAERGDRKMVDWLREQGASYDPLSVVLLDDLEHLEKEILTGRLAPVLFRTAYGRKTLLHQARSPAAVDLLVEHGAPLEVLDAWKSMPLKSALGNRRPEVARALIKHGANTEGEMSNGIPFEVFLNRLESD